MRRARKFIRSTMSASYGKSTFIANYAAAWAKANPRKKGVILTGTDEGAKRARKQLTEANGGARPFNISVKRL